MSYPPAPPDISRSSSPASTISRSSGAKLRSSSSHAVAVDTLDAHPLLVDSSNTNLSSSKKDGGDELKTSPSNAGGAGYVVTYQTRKRPTSGIKGVNINALNQSLAGSSSPGIVSSSASPPLHYQPSTSPSQNPFTYSHSRGPSYSQPSAASATATTSGGAIGHHPGTSSGVPSTGESTSSGQSQNLHERLQAQNLKAELQNLGLGSESAGWGMVMKLANLPGSGSAGGIGKDWEKLADGLRSGKITLLLPLDPAPSSSHTSDPITPSFILDHAVVTREMDTAISLSGGSNGMGEKPKMVTFSTLSGMKGFIEGSKIVVLSCGHGLEDYGLAGGEDKTTSSSNQKPDFADPFFQSQLLGTVSPTVSPTSTSFYPTFTILSPASYTEPAILSIPRPRPRPVPPIPAGSSTNPSGSESATGGASNSGTGAGAGAGSGTTTTVGAGKDAAASSKKAASRFSHLFGRGSTPSSSPAGSPALSKSETSSLLDVPVGSTGTSNSSGTSISGETITDATSVLLKDEPTSITGSGTVGGSNSGGGGGGSGTTGGGGSGKSSSPTLAFMVPVYAIDGVLKRKHLLPGVGKGVEGRLRNQLRGLLGKDSGMDVGEEEKILDKVCSFAAKMHPSPPLKSSSKSLHADHSSHHSRSASHDSSSASLATRNDHVPLHLGGIEDVATAMQDMFASVRDDLFDAAKKIKQEQEEPSQTTEDLIDAATERIEAVVCYELYDRIFCAPGSGDVLADDSLASRIAGLHMLDLTLDHLGVDLDPEAYDTEFEAARAKEGLEEIVVWCGNELAKLNQTQHRSPAAKLAILVNTHKIIVDGLSALPPVPLKDDKADKMSIASSRRPHEEVEMGETRSLGGGNSHAASPTFPAEKIWPPDVSSALPEIKLPEASVEAPRVAGGSGGEGDEGQVDLVKGNDGNRPRSGSLQSRKSLDETRTSSADLILPILIYAVVESNPKHLVSNLLYSQRFRADALSKGEAAYCSVNLFAVTDYLESVDLEALGLGSQELSSESSISPARVSATLRGKMTSEFDNMVDSATKVISGVVDSSFKMFFNNNPRTNNNNTGFGTGGGFGGGFGGIGPKTIEDVKTVLQGGTAMATSTANNIRARRAAASAMVLRRASAPLFVKQDEEGDGDGGGTVTGATGGGTGGRNRSKSEAPNRELMDSPSKEKELSNGLDVEGQGEGALSTTETDKVIEDLKTKMKNRDREQHHHHRDSESSRSIRSMTTSLFSRDRGSGGGGDKDKDTRDDNSSLSPQSNPNSPSPRAYSLRLGPPPPPPYGGATGAGGATGTGTIATGTDGGSPSLMERPSFSDRLASLGARFGSPGGGTGVGNNLSSSSPQVTPNKPSQLQTVYIPPSSPSGTPSRPGSATSSQPPSPIAILNGSSLPSASGRNYHGVDPSSQLQSRLQPPLERFMNCENVGELRISEVEELLGDYKRLAGVLRELGLFAS